MTAMERIAELERRVSALEQALQFRPVAEEFLPPKWLEKPRDEERSS